MTTGTEYFESCTVGNNLAGDSIFTQQFTGGAGSAKSSSANPYAGSKHGRLVMDSDYCQVKAPFGSFLAYQVIRFYWFPSGFPTGSNSYLVWPSSGFTSRGWIGVTGSGSSSSPVAIGRTSGSDATSGVSIPAGQWYRVEYIYDGAGAGTHRGLMWTGATLESPNDSDAIIDLSAIAGGTSQDGFWIGPQSSGAGSPTWDYDGLDWADSGRLGPLGTVAPTGPDIKVRKSGSNVDADGVKVYKSGAFVDATGAKVYKSGAWVDA